jgi:fumarate reductase subunit D
MEWIFIGIAALVVLTLAVLPIWKAKHQPGSVHGRFDFDGYKEGELSQRGVQDKTKWR